MLYQPIHNRHLASQSHVWKQAKKKEKEKCFAVVFKGGENLSHRHFVPILTQEKWRFFLYVFVRNPRCLSSNLKRDFFFFFLLYL